MNRKHMPVLDGIRGIAIIAVLMRHVAYVFTPHGPVTRWFLPVFQFGAWGVDLFFALSGFLITGILLDTRSAENRASSFYGRRILRILPVYYLMIAIVFIGEHFSLWLRSAANLQNATDHMSYLFYFQNFIPMWHHGQYPESTIGPFWSLAIEEQFYLIWPMVVWRLTPRSIVKVCAVALCTTLTLRSILVPLFGSGIWLFALTPTRSDGLFVGAGLAAILAIRREFPKPLLAWMAGAGAMLLGGVAVFGATRELWETGRLMGAIGITGLALLSGALIGFSLEYRDSRVGQMLQAPWLRSFGKYSYGMYVFHVTIYYGVQAILERQFGIRYPLPVAYGLLYFVALLGTTYGLAWLSFNLYESRFLALKRYFEPRMEPATVGFVSPLQPMPAQGVAHYATFKSAGRGA
jgi:peptidoglycan/LPS O-acetylase OafA/YrhL